MHRHAHIAIVYLSYFYVGNIQPVDKMLVGHPQKIRCLVDTPDITNPDNVNISWTGPNGAIGNTGRLRITPTFSNGTNHISTLEFSNLNEEDEGLYKCNTTVLGYEENKTALINLTNLTLSKLALVNVITCSYLYA